MRAGIAASWATLLVAVVTAAVAASGGRVAAPAGAVVDLPEAPRFLLETVALSTVCLLVGWRLSARRRGPVAPERLPRA